MKRFIYLATLTGVLLIGGSGCDLLDATNVRNPNLTEESVLATPRPLKPWIAGLERQLAVVYQNFPTEAEIASDNYVNVNTFYDQELDNLDLRATNQNIDLALFAISDLRASARFGLEEVVPANEGTTDDQLAQLHYYEGLASLLMGELFFAAPAEPDGAAVPAAEHLSAAAEAFTQAVNLTSDADDEATYRLLMARTYHRLGRQSEAVEQAEAALALDEDHVRFVRFDAQNTPTNDLQNALFDRGNFDDLQPLPRLDFLDPKYFPRGVDDAFIPFVKAEEAYLILAEAALAQDDLTDARRLMSELIALVESREVVELDDNVEGRTDEAPGTRPNTAAWEVRASPQDTFRTSLVLTRNGEGVFIDVPVVSGTSVTESIVERLGSVEDALEWLYLMRQEIFIAEGRRMVDLGVKWPISEPEILSNPNINEGDPATAGYVPPYLEPIRTELDALANIDYDAQQVTIQHNLNRILAQNRTSEDVVPFF